MNPNRLTSSVRPPPVFASVRNRMRRGFIPITVEPRRQFLYMHASARARAVNARMQPKIG